jgi:hypothetical protein
LPTCSSPVRHVSRPKPTPSDLHALGAPPALILSQDQTLHQDRPTETGRLSAAFRAPHASGGPPLENPPAPSSARPPPAPRTGTGRRASFSKVLHRPTSVGQENAPSKGGGNQLDPETSGSGEGRLVRRPTPRWPPHRCQPADRLACAAGLPLDSPGILSHRLGRVKAFSDAFFRTRNPVLTPARCRAESCCARARTSSSSRSDRPPRRP